MGMIQIRDVPDDVHRTLKARAAMRGMTLSDYLRLEIERVARTPTAEELDERIRTRGRARVSASEILKARDAGRRA